MKIHLKDSSESQSDELEYDVGPDAQPIPFVSRITSSPRESLHLRRDGATLEVFTST